MGCISLVIADRHPVVLQGLTSVLGARNGFKVVACCSDGPSCIEAIRRLVPGIAILDTSMPGLTGLEILTIANSERISTRLVLPHLFKTANWLWPPPPVPTVSF